MMGNEPENGADNHRSDDLRSDDLRSDNLRSDDHRCDARAPGGPGERPEEEHNGQGGGGDDAWPNLAAWRRSTAVRAGAWAALIVALFWFLSPGTRTVLMTFSAVIGVAAFLAMIDAQKISVATAGWRRPRAIGLCAAYAAINGLFLASISLLLALALTA